MYERSGRVAPTLECTIEATQPDVDPHAFAAIPTKPDTRVEIAWDTVHVGEPFAAFVWKPDDAHNREYAARWRRDGTVPQRRAPSTCVPVAGESGAGAAVRHAAWIHAGSDDALSQAIARGGEIEVRAIPLDKWERKGHQFIKLYVAYVVGGEIAAEIWHTAIFRVGRAKA